MNRTKVLRRERQLRELVDERRAELLARLRAATREGRLGTSAARDAVFDDADASQSELQTDIFFSLLQLAAGNVAEGEAALRRLEDGSYGLCERCGELISEGRLRAMPFARRCTPCEDERDRERSTHGWDNRLLSERWPSR